MISLSKNISFLLFSALILFMVMCAYLGYSSINEGFSNGKDDSEESADSEKADPESTKSAPDSEKADPASTKSAPDSETTKGNATKTTGNATKTTGNATKITISNRPDIAPGIPNLMNNGYKIPQTNLVQSHFNGTSNVYSPYLYMKESFQPMTYDMDKYKSF